jgi:hypothetical protein
MVAKGTKPGCKRASGLPLISFRAPPKGAFGRRPPTPAICLLRLNANDQVRNVVTWKARIDVTANNLNVVADSSVYALW